MASAITDLYTDNFKRFFYPNYKKKQIKTTDTDFIWTP